MMFFLPAGAQPLPVPQTLALYILAVRRLLHEAVPNVYTDAQLTDYINEARNRVVGDTGCNRKLQLFSTVAGQEVNSFTALPYGASTIDVLNVTLIWGNSRIVLDYKPFTAINAQLRAWVQLQSRPVVWSQYGQGSFYVAPVPDQVYQMEIDTVVLPAPLINTTDVDILVYPYTLPVSYYAAYLAKMNEQMESESSFFYSKYIDNIKTALRSTVTRRIPSVYR